MSNPAAQKKFNLLKSSSVFGFWTACSRVFGLMRDIAIATQFGAAADVFLIAYKVPNILRHLFAEGSLSSALVPVISETKTRDGHQATQLLFAKIFGTFGIFAFGITLIGMILSPGIVLIMAPGYWDQPEQFWLMTILLILIFPYLSFISLTACASSALQSYGRFASSAAAPIVLNLCIILSALFFSSWFDQPLYALALAVSIGGIAQFLLQLPGLKKARLIIKPVFEYQSPEIRKIFHILIPLLFSASIYPLHILLDTAVASFLESGSISWLYYSIRLSQLPVGIVAVGVALVILPKLSEYRTRSEHSMFTQTVHWGTRMILLVSIPATIGLIMFAEPIVVTVFQYGEMTAHDISKIVSSLRAYACSISAWMLIKVLIAAVLAHQKPKKLARIWLISMVIGVTLNIPLAVLYDHVGLAISTACTAYITLGLFLYYFNYLRQEIWNKTTQMYSIKLLAANLCLFLTLFFCQSSAEVWFNFPQMERIYTLAVIIGVGVIVYLCALYFFGFRKKDFSLDEQLMNKAVI